MKASPFETTQTRDIEQHYEDILETLQKEQRINCDEMADEIIALCNQVRAIHKKYKEEKRHNNLLRTQIAELSRAGNQIQIWKEIRKMRE
jgi:hypothetical protein